MKIQEIIDFIVKIPRGAYLVAIVFDFLAVWYFLKWKAIALFILIILIVCFAYASTMQKEEPTKEETMVKKKHEKPKKRREEKEKESDKEEISDKDSLFNFNVDDYSDNLDKALKSI